MTSRFCSECRASGSSAGALQEAVARVHNSEKPRQVFPKKSLGAKVVKQANVAATTCEGEGS